jgi:hypothetical protein
MIDPNTGLVNESPIRVVPRLYLWSDNVLCATVLKTWNQTIYNQLVNKTAEVKKQYNLKSLSPWTLLCDPDVITRVGMQKSFNHNNDFQIKGTNYWYSNYDGNSAFSKEAPYVNIQFLRAIDYFRQGKTSDSKWCYNKAMSYWDGSGFADKTITEVNTGKYELYKYALYKIAQKTTGFQKITPPTALAAMNQDDKGAVYTHYKKETISDYKQGKPFKPVSSTNTETASFCLLAGFSSTNI